VLRSRLAVLAAVAAVGGVLAAVPASHAGAAGGPCSTPPLPARERSSGETAVRHYLRWRTAEFAPDLMGYRKGPRLGPPSKRERSEIVHERGQRELFHENTSTLLIRRLLRDRSKAVRDNADLLDYRMTPIEVRAHWFEERFGAATERATTYAGRCLADTYGGVYRSKPREGVTLTFVFTDDPSSHLAALRQRFRYGSRIRVAQGRWTLTQLQAVSDRIFHDDEAALERLGVDVNGGWIDEEHNEADVGVSHPTAAKQQILTDRYGPMVKLVQMYPPVLLRRSARAVPSPPWPPSS